MTPHAPLSFGSVLFSRRGWFLAVPGLIVLVARALTPAGDAPLRPEWLIYVAAAAALRLWSGAHLGDHGNDAQARAPRLARTGPYRFSRNPLYIANILAAAGLILFANALPVAVALTLIILVIAHHIVLVHHEEKTLLALHGDAYERYRREVPRWYGLMRPHATRQSARAEEGGGVTLQALLRRQGRNVGYLAVCVLAIWVASRLGPATSGLTGP